MTSPRLGASTWDTDAVRGEDSNQLDRTTGTPLTEVGAGLAQFLAANYAAHMVPMKVFRYFLLASAAVLVVLALAAGWFYFDVLTPEEKQIRDSGRCRQLAKDVLSFRESTGQAPLDLRQWLRSRGEEERGWSAWGYPVGYLSDGDLFLIVIFGSDGRPDGENYLAMRKFKEKKRVCGDASQDIVCSDLGVHRACLK